LLVFWEPGWRCFARPLFRLSSLQPGYLLILSYRSEQGEEMLACLGCRGSRCSQDLCTHCPRALKPASRLLVVALRFLKLCQRAPGFPGEEMRLAHLLVPNAQGPPVERLRFTCKCDY